MSGLLYHYTSIAGFIGIVCGRHLRMTRFDQLNDTQELNTALQYLKDELEKFDCPEKSRGIKRAYKELLDNALQRNELYITSFSEHKNHLEQWRAYTPAGGVAIGFARDMIYRGHYPEYAEVIEQDTKTTMCFYAQDYQSSYLNKLEQIPFPSRPPAGQTFPCTYDEKEIRRQAKEGLQELLNNDTPNFLGLNSDGTADPENNFMLYITNTLLCCGKHPVYSGEREHRWVNSFPLEEDYPERLDEKGRKYVRAGIIPGKIIKEVWISPHGDTETFRKIVEFYKKSEELDFKIYESELPYRA